MTISTHQALASSVIWTTFLLALSYLLVRKKQVFAPQVKYENPADVGEAAEPEQGPLEQEKVVQDQARLAEEKRFLFAKKTMQELFELLPLAQQAIEEYARLEQQKRAGQEFAR